ncbi:MAG: GNAT family N-acetyltransferase [Glaciecola sp.]
MHWIIKSFEELTNNELYDLLKLRCDVFIVEQTCYYPDLDDKDRVSTTKHVLAYDNGELKAYSRILAPEVSYPEHASIGRVIVLPETRGTGLGHTLMNKSNEQIAIMWPASPCKISAQYHLKEFYQQHGFSCIGDSYLEDGIPHIAMVKAPHC